MAFSFYPERFIKQILEKNGIDSNDLYSSRASAGITKKNKSALRRFSMTLYFSVMRFIKKINKSKEKKAGDAYDASIERSVIQTSQYQIMTNLNEQEKERKKAGKAETMVKILPSRAKEQDVYHARFYGRVMPLSDAVDLGITTRYGCKCGLQVMNNEADFKNVVNKFNKK